MLFRHIAILVFGILIIAWVPKATGQQITGTITGSVQDTSGATIVGASVRLTNTGTGATQANTSDAAGNFQFLLLPPGTYSLEAQAQGFKTFRRDGLIVESDRSMAVPAVLTVGEVTETVEVSGSSPLLDPNTSSLGTTMDRQKIADLPLVSRNPFGLANLIPTVKTQGFFGGQVFTTFSNSTLLIGGGTPLHNGFMLDGLANNKLGSGTGPMMTLPQDDVQEFKVLTNAMPAEFGYTGGGVVSVISMSGTNEYHGNVYDFLRNSITSSNDFFSNKSGAPKPSLSLNQFGGVLGGPIKKDKVFFFLDADIYKERRSNGQNITSPSALERAGNFSQTLNSSGQMITMYDPLTTQPNPSQSGASIRLPFAGNVIPTNRISVISQQVFSLFPLGNLPGLPFTHGQNLYQVTHNPIDMNTWGGKVDYLIDPAKRLAVRYTRQQLYWTLDDFFNNLLDNNARKFAYIPRQSGSINFTDTLSPSLLLDVKMGISRDYDQGFPRATLAGGFDITTWGFPAALRDSLPKFKNGDKGLVPGLTIIDAGLSSGTTVGGGVPHGRSGYTWANGISLTKVAAAHTVKWGYEYRFYGYNPFNGTTPIFTFDRGFTQGPNPTTASTIAGSGVASLELGYPGTGSFLASPSDTTSRRYHGFFVQDDWKVSRKLTLNLGLRWEYESPLSDRNNVYANFDPSVASPLKVPGLNLLGGLSYPGVNGVPHALYDRSYDHFGPRFGFAYQALPRLVARGGYGMFWEPINGADPTQTTGFSSSTTMVTSLDGGLTPFNTISNPFPNGFTQASGSSLGALTGIGTAIVGQLRPINAGYVQQWNFTLQYEPVANLLIEAAYLGNKGTHLMVNSVTLNQISPANLALGNALNQKVTNPFFGLVTSGPLSTATVSRQQLLLPYPQYVSVSGGFGFLGDSIYHAFTLKVEKRMSNGVSFLGAYTFSKLIDAVTNGALNWYNLRAERATSINDIPHRVVLTALWNVPFGKNATGWRRQVIKGWQINGITTIQEGQPINFGVVSRPNVVAGCNVKLDSPTIAKWFNTACFTPSAPFTYGNASRTIPGIFGPGIFNVDVSAFKDFFLTERVKLQLRAAAYNLTNTPQFQNPGVTVGNATFGVVTATGITGTTYAPGNREMQFALRLSF